MGNFFSFSYWFGMRPGALSPKIQTFWLLFLGILVVVFIVSWIFKSRTKNIFTKIWVKFNYFAICNIIIGLVLLFFYYEMLPFLSMRLWALLWGLGMIGWFGYIVYLILQIPKVKAEKEKVNEFNKYIP